MIWNHPLLGWDNQMKSLTAIIALTLATACHHTANVPYEAREKWCKQYLVDYYRVNAGLSVTVLECAPNEEHVWRIDCLVKYTVNNQEFTTIGTCLPSLEM